MYANYSAPLASALSTELRFIVAERDRESYPKQVSTHSTAYILDDQVGFVLRRVTQRHLALFSNMIPQITTTQFAALAKLTEEGPLSQNRLGRATAMDAATIKGVVDRLRAQGLVQTLADPGDRRRLTVSLTEAGMALFESIWHMALEVTERTLAPLTAEERATLTRLLLKLV